MSTIRNISVYPFLILNHTVFFFLANPQNLCSSLEILRTCCSEPLLAHGMYESVLISSNYGKRA
ncbi:hypothetical protein BYT27DRAFT_7196005 [Phlegmacium glaucopus]|nr:hypothetical protein BYT27DRAFT_7196005 [Phlegmacium glaucopus]